MARRPVTKRRPSFGGSTKEDLTTEAKRVPITRQRVRIVLELDIAEENYSRDDLNTAAVGMAADFHNRLQLDIDRVDVVYLTTEEVEVIG